MCQFRDIWVQKFFFSRKTILLFLGITFVKRSFFEQILEISKTLIFSLEKNGFLLKLPK